MTCHVCDDVAYPQAPIPCPECGHLSQPPFDPCPNCGHLTCECLAGEYRIEEDDDE
jgi:hypothetical protein